MSVADEIRKLTELRDQGALTPDEFARAKARLLGEPAAPQSESGGDAAANALSSFRRSVNDRLLGGVCGGLARSTHVESWVWRLLFVFSSLVAGIGFIPYLLLWIFVPAAD